MTEAERLALRASFARVSGVPEAALEAMEQAELESEVDRAAHVAYLRSMQDAFDEEVREAWRLFEEEHGRWPSEAEGASILASVRPAL